MFKSTRVLIRPIRKIRGRNKKRKRSGAWRALP